MIPDAMGASSGINLYFVSAITQIISFISGTCLTWSSPTQSKMSGNSTDSVFPDKNFTEDSPEIIWISSLLTVGAIFGSIGFGPAAGKFGRKPILFFIGVPFLISYLMLAFTKNVYCFMFARFIAGLSVGGTFTVVPMYSGEIAEDSNRGTLGAAMNCFITLGLLTSSGLGPYLPFMWFNVILAVFPIIFLITFPLVCPESPYFLMKTNFHKAEESLRYIRGTYDVSKEMTVIKEVVEDTEEGSFLEIVSSPTYRKAFIIGAGLLFFQQFSGINVVLFDGQSIFTDKNGGGGGIPAEVGPIILSGVQFGTSFISPIFSDISGRKILLLISHVSMVIVEVLLGLYFVMSPDGYKWIPIALLVMYITVYNVGSGPIPWAVLGELFPSSIKNSAAAGSSAVCWTCGFFITQYFKPLSKLIGEGETFWIFAGFGVFATLFVIFFVIETKGKSLQQIQDELSGRR